MKSTSKSCHARQYSSGMYCGRCGLNWDVNDPYPPKCLSREEIAQIHIKELRNILNKK